MQGVRDTHTRVYGHAAKNQLECMVQSKSFLSKQLHGRAAQLGSTQVHAWMFPYVLGYRDRVPFFNVEETILALQKALLFVQQIHARKGHMLLVNTNPAFASLVKKTASLMGHPYVNEYWIGGLLTNWQQLKYSVHAYKKFELFMSSLVREDGVVFPKYGKAQKRFEGVQHMQHMPDVVIVLQATTTYKHILEEAKRLKIPVITCMDTYAPHVHVEYPIPVNVHAKAFFHFFCRLLVKVCARTS
jgi:small subunit ribosomal protein S2